MSDYSQEPGVVIPPSRIDESRRRRARKLLVPRGKSERALYLGEIAQRLVPGVEFFLFSLVAGLVITLAILLDSPAIFILGALLAPFMAPVIGLGFSAVIGSFTFFSRSIGAMFIGCALVFASGALGGWISRLFVDLPLSQSLRFTNFSIPDFLLLTIGIVLAVYLTIRMPKQRTQVASVPLAYEIFIPVAVAGYGLTSRASGLFPNALIVAGVHIAWVILAGTLTLAVLKIRPFTFFGYLLTAAIFGSALYGLVISSALGVALQRQLAPFVTSTGVPSAALIEPSASLSPADALAIQTPDPFGITATTAPTNTLMPTLTPTVTITPQPTPVWAKVFSPTYSGVLVRQTPGFDGKYLTSLDNESLIQVLPEVEHVDGAYWAHVLLEDGREGWIMRSLLLTATPAPNW